MSGEISEQLESELAKLYAKYPELAKAEGSGRHRLKARVPVLSIAPRSGVGVEIGAFTGMFSSLLDSNCRPIELYLLDPWDLLHGETFPNWGKYTANQMVPTQAAHLAAEVRAKKIGDHCQVVKDFSTKWLSTLEEGALDWVYLDASHKYDYVMKDLRGIDRVLAAKGVIMGDDSWVHRNQQASEVFFAVQDFASENGYCCIHQDRNGQWAITRKSNMRDTAEDYGHKS